MRLIDNLSEAMSDLRKTVERSHPKSGRMDALNHAESVRRERLAVKRSTPPERQSLLDQLIDEMTHIGLSYSGIQQMGICPPEFPFASELSAIAIWSDGETDVMMIRSRYGGTRVMTHDHQMSSPIDEYGRQAKHFPSIHSLAMVFPSEPFRLPEYIRHIAIEEP